MLDNQQERPSCQEVGADFLARSSMRRQGPWQQFAKSGFVDHLRALTECCERDLIAEVWNGFRSRNDGVTVQSPNGIGFARVELAILGEPVPNKGHSSA